MPRIARIVAPGFAHHITQRGNRRMETFFCDDDYRAYLSLLVEWCGRYGNRILSYCLMPNHVHLILVPTSEMGLARGLGEVHRRYTRRINFREGWRGYLWQGRFTSFVMDDSYLLSAARYVERNPVLAGLVVRAEDWPWSSAAAHTAGRGDAVAEGEWLIEMTKGWVCTWGEYILKDDEKTFAPAMRRAENTGRPLGNEKFIKKLSTLMNRNLLPKKPGPKPKVRN